MTGQDRLARLERSVHDIIHDAEQLPTEVLYREPRAGEWPVMSTLAHVAEILPYWAHQAEAIVRSPGGPFGRTHDDPDRIAAVETHAHDAVEAIVPRLRAGLEECVRVLQALPEDAWHVTGQHSRRGRMTVAEMVDAFLVEHAAEHAEQMRATLAALAR